MTVNRLAAAPSRGGAQPEKLFQSQNSVSSSPGSRAGQSLANESDDDDESAASSRGNEDGMFREFTTTQDKDDGDDEILSEDSEVAKHRQVVAMIQNVLETGVASICRLRQLFPSSFFQKYDFDHDGTTITGFNKEAIKSICSGDDDESYDDDDGDDASMVKSFQPKTQKSLSPLTEMSQKRRSGYRERISEQKKRVAMEALLLLRWMQHDGVGEVLRNGNLARVVFGICVDDELIESYSVSQQNEVIEYTLLLSHPI